MQGVWLRARREGELVHRCSGPPLGGNYFRWNGVTVTNLLTISEIKTLHPKDWDALSPQQASFLTEWISGSIGNGRYSAVEACKVAYPRVKNPAAWSSRLLKNKRVARVVQLHLGLSETRAVLFELKALLKRSKRKGTHLELLLAPWLRVAAALESIVARENSNGGAALL